MAVAGFTQPAPDVEPIGTASGAFFALSVADLKASAQWYAGKFGLKTVMQMPKSNGAAVAVLEGGGLIVELVERDDAKPGPSDAMRIHGIAKAGIIVADFDKTVALLKARRVEIAFGPFPATSAQRANVIVKDNAGNLIQFFGKSR